MGKKINIRPSTGVYATYKNIKYDPWTAIAEFVDNSTQSYYDHVDKLRGVKYWGGLHVDITYDRNANGEQLIIRDNAYGMDFRDFRRAIILDSPPKKKTRSEFGMGLKTAACWFGVNWKVESTELGSGIKYVASVDVDALHKYRNEEIEVEEIPCSPKEHGTTITIWNMNRRILGTQVKKTKDQLRGMYRIDLRTGDIQITYNGESLLYSEPKALTETLPDGSKKVWRKEISFGVPYKDTTLGVSGFVAILEKASTSGAGFALVRRGRVIVGGYENAYRPEEVFEKPNSFVYQRLFGELNLDDWPVTQTKDAFDWYNGNLEDDLIDGLKNVCSDYIKKAKEHRVGKKTTVDDVTTTLVNTFTNAGIINNAVVETIPESQENPLTGFSEETTGGATTVPVVPEQVGVTPKPTGKTGDIVVEGTSGKKIAFTTDMGSYVFNLFMKKNDPTQNWLTIAAKENSVYDVEWNIRHPFFKPYIDEPDFLIVMEQFIFALALAEIESQKTSVAGMVTSSSIRLKMNDLLKEVAKGEKANG